MNSVFLVPYGTTGKTTTIYAQIWSTEDLQSVWSVATGTLEPFATTSLGNYTVSLAEIGQTGVYQFTIPIPLQQLGKTYAIVIRARAAAGAAPSQTDTLWGAGTITLQTGPTQQIQVRTA